MLQVNVYFGSSEVTKIEEEVKMDLNSLLSSLGGALSLAPGISLVVVLEFVELGLRITAQIFIRLCAKVVPPPN